MTTDRAQIGDTWVGPWRGTFDWQRVSDKVRVPPKAREAIVRIGLLGATGEMSFDDIRDAEGRGMSGNCPLSALRVPSPSALVQSVNRKPKRLVRQFVAGRRPTFSNSPSARALASRLDPP